MKSELFGAGKTWRIVGSCHRSPISASEVALVSRPANEQLFDIKTIGSMWQVNDSSKSTKPLFPLPPCYRLWTVVFAYQTAVWFVVVHATSPASTACSRIKHVPNWSQCPAKLHIRSLTLLFASKPGAGSALLTRSLFC